MELFKIMQILACYAIKTVRLALDQIIKIVRAVPLERKMTEQIFLGTQNCALTAVQVKHFKIVRVSAKFLSLKLSKGSLYWPVYSV